MMMMTKARPPSTPAMIATVLSSVVSSRGMTAVEGETEESRLWIWHTEGNSLALGRRGVLSLNTVTSYTGTYHTHVYTPHLG